MWLLISAVGCSLIGAVIPPAPNDLTHRSGACITSNRGYAHMCDYSIGILQNASGQPSVVYAGRLVGRDSSGQPTWHVVDTFPHPDLPANYFIAVSTCRLDGRDDQTVIAAVRFEETQEWLDEALWARRFDLDQERFLDVSTKGIDCLNEAWGL
jgi:hypothetical protein